MAEKPKYYITTAIAYTSRKPHIGNSYEIVLTDAIARYKRLQGYDVFFQTGTDEHGQKIEQYAKEAGVSPKEYVDKVSAEIRSICDLLNVSYDKFIRTTDPEHERIVQKIFKKLYDQGDIYKGEYEGMYCTPCESFWTKSQLVDGKCPDCGRPVKEAHEEAYFLKLSKYQKRLEKYIEDHPDFIYPEARKKEMLNNFIKPGLQDLCVSRTSFKWGIPVTFDPKHVIYVWMDALSNYITGIGYDPDGSSDMYKKYWPADAHIIGKDIVRFHTIYWPIMLMALGEPLPKQVYGHPWLLIGNDKMSKSSGNVIYADDLAALFGVDAVRYYLLSEMPHAQDGSITYETMIERYNADLANTLGNLINRSITMVKKYFGGKVPTPTEITDTEKDVEKCALSAVENLDKLLATYHTSDALSAVMDLAKRLNKYIDETEPWNLAKDESKKPYLGTVMYYLIEGIRFLSVLLQPFMPETVKEIRNQLNIGDQTYDSIKTFGNYPAGTELKDPKPIFARIDKEKMFKAIEERVAKSAGEDAVKKIELEPEITIDDFAKTELRAAKVLECEKVKKSKKLLKLQLDDGMGGRQVVSGIAQWYSPEDLIGKTVIIVANLKAAKLCGEKSEGMILAADREDGGAEVVFLPDDVKPGTKLR